MKIQSKSKLFRWAYLWEKNRPGTTDLCSLFWRVVVLSPAKIFAVVAVAALFLSVVVGYFFWLPGSIFYAGHPILGWTAVGALSLFLVTMRDLIWAKSIEDDVTLAVLIMHAVRMAKRAKTSKLCPIIYVQDD